MLCHFTNLTSAWWPDYHGTVNNIARPVTYHPQVVA